MILSSRSFLGVLLSLLLILYMFKKKIQYFLNVIELKKYTVCLVTIFNTECYLQ